jgi:hypothetical protein
VTTMDAAAARRLHPKVAVAVLMAWAGLGLGGCETSASLFGQNSNIAEQAPVALQQPAVQPSLAKVAVAPVIGAPDTIAKQIEQEFTAAVEKQRVSVATRKDEHVDYTLRGYVVAAKDKTSTKISYIWDVTDPSGKRVNRITGEELAAGNASKDPWAAVTPAVSQAIATKVANAFATWVPSQAAQAAVASNATAAQPAGVGAQDATASAAAPHTARPAAKQTPNSAMASATPAQAPTTGSIGREGPVLAIVPAVSGAPGDGSSSLTQAIQRELSSKGVGLASQPTAVAYRVEGTVKLGQAHDGKQAIQIEWLVRDPQGKKLGTVSQKNDIPEGSLDGAWGKTAEQAAGAAAQGIVKLLPQQQRAVN